MARYIDADKLLTDELTHTLPVGCGRASGRVIVFTEDIENAPTADVVPRERYDRVMDNLKSVLAERSTERADVAREIFEEIERIPMFADYDYNGERILCFYAQEYDELKKKYTEGEK